jgi:hypothetical protein
VVLAADGDEFVAHGSFVPCLSSLIPTFREGRNGAFGTTPAFLDRCTSHAFLKYKWAIPVSRNGLMFSGSPYATFFITVLFLQQLTENLQYQLVI